MKITISFLTFFVISNLSTAQWSTDPMVNNPICIASYLQQDQQIISDENGDAIITWSDQRNGTSNADIYAQRINSNGVTLWVTNGIAVCSATGEQSRPQLVSDGSGGAIITWEDGRDGYSNTKIYVQRINANGIVQWTTNGIAICSNAINQQLRQQIISDGNGGAVIVWQDVRSMYWHIYAQKVSSNGTIQWTSTGVPICMAPNNQDIPRLTSDGNGGAIITWEDHRNHPTDLYDLYAQKVNSNGVVQWATDGIAICTGNNMQREPKLISDGNGGAIITWWDERKGTIDYDIYVQKINSNGIVQWTSNGVAVCTASNGQIYPKLISDGNGGAIITWFDLRNLPYYDIYAQKINSNGAPVWIENGVTICTATEEQNYPEIISDENGGAIITWQDRRYGNFDVYAQRINSGGARQWMSQGVEICLNSGYQFYPHFTTDGNGGAIIVWQDMRNEAGEGYFDLYASQVDENGYLGGIPPQNQFSEQTLISLTGVYTSDADWGDCDNDGDLDVVLSGYNNGNSVIKIYYNNGDNTFTDQTPVSLTGVVVSSQAWGDYDNDGDLDLLLSGSTIWSLYTPFTALYKNDGNNIFISQSSIGLANVADGSLAWGDYNNDGDLDILLTGWVGGNPVSKIYRNNGDNTFTEQTSISLIGVYQSAVAWADYDNDNDMDILLTGWSGTDRISKIYRNNGDNTFSDQTSIILTGVYWGSADWGDYDNDGDLDILLTGNSASGPVSKIYLNNGDNTFAEQISIPLTGVDKSSAAWGDYDNDGDLDILLSGWSGIIEISKIYRNNGDNTFTDQTSIILAGVSLGSATCVDYDNDDDLDILLTGLSNNIPISKLYRNNNLVPNSPPSLPSSLSSSLYQRDVTLSWSKSIDNETPQNGLKYNLVIGTSPNSVNTLSPMSDRGTGYRKVISLGNTNHDNSWTIKNMDVGTYYWSVQAVDNNFAGSSFASEQSFIIEGQFTEQTSISLTGVGSSSVAWGDYDGDEDLDILLTGSSESGSVSKIYSNNGDNTFIEQTSIPLIGISSSSVAWGDYDNDGDLDILLTGSYMSKIYRNNGNNSFSEQTSISLAGVSNGAVAWGDYNNDGDLDILLTGYTGTGSKISKIYRNYGNNSFVEQTAISIIGVANGSVDWGDYDNDGDLDFLLTGGAGSGPTPIAIIYRNNGDNSFTEQTSIPIIGVYMSSAIWGDYDNDGDLDILLSGYANTQIVTKIFKNNGDNSFIEQTSLSLNGTYYSDIAWGDYDNDGDLDIVISGYITGGYQISKIYRNDDNNVFTNQTDIELEGVGDGSLAWGDYDNDGDLDLLLTGYSNTGPISKTYRNNNYTANTLPTVPVNLNSSVNELDVTLNWNKSTDTETSQNGLKYNIVIGTNPNAVNILSPMSDRNTGYRKIINLGNTNHNNSWTLKGMAAGTYYWSVQTLDNNFAGSGFATEHSFTIIEQFTEQTSVSLPAVQESMATWGDYDNDNDLDILIAGWNGSNGISRIYQNNGNNTFTHQVSLAGVSNSRIAWGDYDNDGDMDILLTGYNGFNRISKIYRNDGNNTFTEQTSISLTGVSNGSVAWGDYDNDGNLDILITGWTGTNRISKIYRNNGNSTFTEQTAIPLTGVDASSVAWGDYDNDGDFDILLTGSDGNGGVSKLYRNNGNNTFTEQTTVFLYGVIDGSVAWGDYDNDSDLDILLAGYNGFSYISLIYRNNGNSTFTEQTSISLTGVTMGSVAWGDYDNDSDLDILLSGWSYNGVISKIYRNNSENTFTEKTSITLSGVYLGSVAWGDYDNDRDLDILLTGYTGSSRVSKIYRNNNLIPNTLPNSPTNLTSIVNDQDVTLSWDRGTDDETPRNGLKYNLVIGTNINAVNTLSPMSDRLTGYRRIINLGNANHDTTWTIKGLPEGIYYWSVQSIDNSFGGSQFATEQSFSNMVTPTNWQEQLSLKDASGTDSEAILKFGQKPTATNGIDTSFGESELPPVPPIGIFDVRLILPTIPVEGSLIDLRDSSETDVTWTLTFQPGSAGYPMIFSWDTLNFPSGTIFLTDIINGTIININMRNQSSYTITDPTITSLYIKYLRLATSQLLVNVANGWNMVSIPGLHPTDQNVSTWWQYRDLGANVFRYAGGYQPVTVAAPGIGYWMKHTGVRTYNTGDEWPAGGIQIVAHAPLAGATGWNLIGGYEIAATAANVTTIPAGQQSGPIYKYSGGYQVATTLDPGYGYWIKLLSAAQIIIPETLAKEGKPVEYFPENWGKIVLTDAAGINYTLYAVKGEVDLSQYELPPAPPTGMFDIRYSSGRIAEDLNSAIKTIDMSGVTYPLTVRVEGMDIRMMDETGKTINVNLKDGEDIVISDATISKLMVSGELIPAVYALEQNYPNPFNPSTMIEFSLPENVGNVKLSIYNALGEKVAELVNTSLVAGKYSYQWNAQNVATGMYIYELRTDKFVSVKKMILIK